MGYLDHRTLTIFCTRMADGFGLVDFIVGGESQDHFHYTRRSNKQARISDRGAKVALWWECELKVVRCGGSRLSRSGNRARIGTNF